MEFLTGVLLYVVFTCICATSVAAVAAAAVYVINSFRQSSHTATRESADSGAVGRDSESKSDERKKKRKRKRTRKKLNGGSQKESEESEHRDVADGPLRARVAVATGTTFNESLSTTQKRQIRFSQARGNY